MSYSEQKAIYFWREYKENGFLSNFHSSKFEINGITFNCNEQYYVYRKCIHFDTYNQSLINNILNEYSPYEVKKYGRLINNFDQMVWNNHKYSVMLEGLINKFTQNPELAQMLLNTRDAYLYEASPYDRIWGIGYTTPDAYNIELQNYGENLLGKCLMEVRKYIIDIVKSKVINN